MTTHHTSPARKTYGVFADYTTRCFQEIEAETPQQAHAIASERPDCWQNCFEHEGSDDYRLSPDVQDVATAEYHRIDGATHCRTCGSEIVETVNASAFGDGECGVCEHGRYKAQFVLVGRYQELVQTAESVVASWETGQFAMAVQNLFRVASGRKSLPPQNHEHA